jgi:hypothetical protein
VDEGEGDGVDGGHGMALRRGEGGR